MNFRCVREYCWGRVEKKSAQDLAVVRLSEGKRTFARGKVLVLEVESFYAGGSFSLCKYKESAALKNFSARDFSNRGLSRGNRTFARGKDVSKFSDSSAGSIDGSIDWAIDGSIDDSIDGLIDGSIDGLVGDSLAAVFFWFRDILSLKSFAGGRELSRFVPKSLDGSGARSFDGSIDGSDDGCFARTGSFSMIISSASAELKVG